jgi:tetratricopeptide (TPR) repeat protein
MRSVEALKEKARRHEQNEEWQPARDLYMQAIEALGEEAQLDIGLYNRVGDILVKIGDFEKAVQHYEQATDLYLDAELPNNAIAVCKKVARHLPGRNEVYLRMGQIRASQGFLVDARENFLIYAAKVERAGDTEEALRALVEFAALAPEDTEIRLAVAEQLEKHGRQAEALEQLVAGYRVLRQRGGDEQAGVFAARIRELDPEADPDALAGALQPESFDSTALDGDHGEGDAFAASFGEIELPSEPDGAEESAEPVDEISPTTSAEADPGALTVVDADFGEIVVVGGDGEAPEPTDDGGTSRGEGSPDEASAVADEDPREDAGDLDFAGDLPLIAFGGDEEGEGDVIEVSGEIGEVVVPGDEEVAEYSEASWEDDGADEPTDEPGDEPEWLIGFGDDEEGEGDAEADVPLPFLDLAEDRDDGAEAAEPGPSEPAERDPGAGDWAASRADYDAGSPNVERAESLVETAFQNGDPAVLVEAYELLARALEARGDEVRAWQVWSQVRELDPGHAEAARALGAGDADESPGSVVDDQKGSYVDLGSMIFGEEEAPEKTTRFRVAYQEPTGDEAADFAKMLSQFKAKVAENFDASDVRAHHDLGTAYKEMGLLNEAVAEFQQALRASADHLPTYELLGQTFMERGEHAAAVRVLERALKIPSEVEDELIGIYYYLGRAHQELGQVDEAVGFYDRVFALDINFADVTSRLRELR